MIAKLSKNVHSAIVSLNELNYSNPRHIGMKSVGFFFFWGHVEVGVATLYYYYFFKPPHY